MVECSKWTSACVLLEQKIMLPLLFVSCMACFAAAYLFYGRLLSRRFGLDDSRKTPAHTMKDGMDYCPARAPVLFGHHFSSIAGAGPILGPIIAGLAFGWLPALLWIVIGSIFIGGVLDSGSLAASIRHKAKSIAEIARKHMSPAANKLFLVFIWLSLILLLAAFIDVTAKTFVKDGGVATSSFIFIVLAIAFGVTVYRMRLPFSIGTLTFACLVFAGIYIGYRNPADISSLGNALGISTGQAYTWILAVYCFIASIAPVWLLLQSRDYLSSFLLYGCLAGGFLGILFFTGPVEYPAFLTWNDDKLGFLLPGLFILIACGACSGFHSLVSSGTTSKQLGRETDAVRIGYGAMLVEAVLALIALCAIMICARGDASLGRHPTEVFASGLGSFATSLGIPQELGFKFGLLAISTFLLTTLDTATRLGRYTFEELAGSRGLPTKLLANLFTLGIPLLLLNIEVKGQGGAVMPAYKMIWPMFGATNQLLGGLALLTITVWLKKTGRKAVFTLIPMVFIIGMTMTALVDLIRSALYSVDGKVEAANYIKAGYSGLLFLLAVFLVIEAVRALRNR